MLNPEIDALSPRPLETVRIAGIDLHDVDGAECVNHVMIEASSGRGGWIVTPNADIARQANRDPMIAQLVARATMRVADGMPLVWASRIVGTPLRERVCGSDLVWSLSERAAQQNLSVFLLGGGQEDTASKAAAVLKERYPNLRIAGTWFPPFGFEINPMQKEAMRLALRKAAPDIVYVALGFPKAERLIDELREVLPNAWWIGVGISLSFICEEVPRAPVWMQKVGLEWLHRLTQEPGRLAKRYLWHDLPFVARLLASCLLSRQTETDSTARRLPSISARR